ncbi:hypothetical protein SAMN04488057_10761 [Cyclobacterium lianum]|uniref:Uncharacterized protein n=1 Tax=Cyclobacterium lianum TaxID=388280 RepID=A0A1M7P6F1_9BACT|nr:hypothetical protein [Cyclobacterium lianum]SHN12149.1 hypothetical protein SAMN04488057_10761 [Cyclobacterium lianum]
MKLTFLLLVLVHGLIHSLGMIRAFDWMQLKEFTAEVSRGMGLLWLTASLLFLLFGLFYYWGWRHSLYIGVAAVLLSQILILLYWKDARFGTCHPDNKGSSEPKSLQILRFAGFFIFYVSVRFRQFQQK